MKASMLAIYCSGILVAFSAMQVTSPTPPVDWQMSILIGMALFFTAFTYLVYGLRLVSERSKPLSWHLRESPYLKGGSRFEHVVDWAFYGTSNAFGVLLKERFYYNAAPRIAAVLFFSCLGLATAAVAVKVIVLCRKLSS